MRVQDLMAQPAISCDGEDSLQDAAGKMWDEDCGALPVVSSDNAVVGIITDRDVCMAAYVKERRLDEIAVADIARRKVFSVRPQDSLQDAEDTMRDHQVRRVPVVDDNDQLVGMLSLNDLAREAAHEQNQQSKEIDSVEVLQTLAAIGQSNRAQPPPWS